MTLLQKYLKAQNRWYYFYPRSTHQGLNIFGKPEDGEFRNKRSTLEVYLKTAKWKFLKDPLKMEI